MAGYFGKANVILDTGMLILRKAEISEEVEIKLAPEEARKLSTLWPHETIDPNTFEWPD